MISLPPFGGGWSDAKSTYGSAEALSKNSME